MSYILMFIGWVLAATSSIIWAARGIYQLFKTDLGFWEILFSNGGFWLLQLVVGVGFIVVGVTVSKIR